MQQDRSFTIRWIAPQAILKTSLKLQKVLGHLWLMSEDINRGTSKPVTSIQSKLWHLYLQFLSFLCFHILGSIVPWLINCSSLILLIDHNQNRCCFRSYPSALLTNHRSFSMADLRIPFDFYLKLPRNPMLFDMYSDEEISDVESGEQQASLIA